jgi:CubicO group peptidase (beta-lactamase class C family)
MKLSSLAGWTATLLALTLPRGYSDPGDLPDAVLQQIVDTYVGNAYRRGEATAFSVGITLNGNTFFKSYGFKSFGDTAPTNQINEHSIFELGSVTKVWTTALVGQAVATGTLITDDETGTGPPTTVPVAISIYTTLGDFPAALPLLLAPMKEVTIGELASFTAGFPDVGSTNGNGNRPPISRWGVSDFVAAVSQLVPTNYNEFPPLPVPLPAPYFYSDWSTGLLGLLLANLFANSPLSNDAVQDWFSLVKANIVTPLGMADTYLFEPGTEQAEKVVQGYEQATGEAVVTAGRISAITLKSPGGQYSSAPTITITGGGGTGAVAQAIMQGSGDNLSVRRIRLTNHGRRYPSGPQVELLGGKGSGAEGQAIVSDDVNGNIIGVQMLKPGSGYKKAPKVQFSAPTRSVTATGTAIISNGTVIGVNITNPGSGYVGPPVVTIAPGGNHVNVVPVWAAAGSLKSSASDLIRLCQLYLGQQEIDGNSVPINLSLGARFALQALIQNTSSDPTNFVGMAWQTSTNAIEGGFNLSVVKDGALPGFASYVELTPAIDLGVVILRSNNQTGTAEYEDPIGNLANAVSLAIQGELMSAP